MRKVNHNKPLCQEHREKLSEYMARHGLTKTGLGKLMGCKRSTFRDIMEGRDTLRRNHEFIKRFIEYVVDGHINPNDFLKARPAVDSLSLPPEPRLGTTNEAEALGITGNETPVFPKTRIERTAETISLTAQSLSLQLEPFLIEGGIGDRRLLQEKTGSTLMKLLTLLRGASSEAVLQKMTKEDPNIFKQ